MDDVAALVAAGGANDNDYDLVVIDREPFIEV